MTLSNLELSTEDRAKLLDIVAKGSDWRVCHRAQTLLYFNDGLSAKAIMAQQELNLDTVYDRRKNWLLEGFSSLYDKHRSGAPSKMNAVHLDQKKTWAEEEALTATSLVAWRCCFGASVHLWRQAVLVPGCWLVLLRQISGGFSLNYEVVIVTFSFLSS